MLLDQTGRVVRAGAGRGRLGWRRPGSGWLSGLQGDAKASALGPDASLGVSGWKSFSKGGELRAAGPWRGAISVSVPGTRPAMGALRGRSLRHERGRKGRAHHDTDGDGGAVVGPRLPAGRGTLEASERAPFARPAQAWGVSRPPAHLSMPTPSVVPWARRTGPLPPPWLSSSLPVAGPMRTLASTGRSLSTACRRATGARRRHMHYVGAPCRPA